MIRGRFFGPSESTPEFLHLIALNAFGLVQPILDRLAANPGFLHSSGYSGAAVFSTIALLLAAIPVSVTLMISMLRRGGWHRTATAVLGIVTGLLTVMSLLIVSRWISASLNLLTFGIPDSGAAFCAVGAGMAAVWLYFRSDRYRRFLCICAVGAIVFPVNFFASAAIRDAVLGVSARQHDSSAAARNPVPAVMIVFDGLCGMAILNEKHEIDRVRYPSFARLGDISSFYRNTTTVHTRTDHALPAILSSCVPEETQKPVEADYPTNLFRLIHRTGQYDMTVFEPFTHLCPDELARMTRERSLFEQTTRLLEILLRVHAKISMPQDLEILDVHVPREWFGMASEEQLDRSARNGKIVYAWDSGRDVQCEHFADCLDLNAKPGFRFLHVAIPHDPWSLLPSGKSYVRLSNYRNPIFGSNQEVWSEDELPVHQAWQRYLLQLQFADIWLGRFLDRLEQTEQLEDALIVVTADHGMAFVPGQSRRTPSATTIPDIISVPLFIKQPGQHSAVVSDRNVETIDILPTVAEILGLPEDSRWEGSSLLNNSRERFRKTIQGLNTVIDPQFPQRFRYVDRMLHVFGSGSDHDRLWNLNTIPELVGTEVSRLTAGSIAGYRCRLVSGGATLDPHLSNFVPCSFHGRLSGIADGKAPRQLALALNGIILATTRTSTDPALLNDWGVLLPDSVFRAEGNQVRLFEVESRGQLHILHEIPLEPFRS